LHQRNLVARVFISFVYHSSIHSFIHTFIPLKMISIFILSAIFGLCYAVPVIWPTPTVTISSPQATIVGLAGLVEQFPGIPFAQPPVGRLRLKPPQPIIKPMGKVLAQANGNACPQDIFSTTRSNLPATVAAALLDSPLFQKALSESEDCLVLNVHRPAGIPSGAKLPVLYWIFGGAFELGWNSMYNGALWVEQSIKIGQPIVVVTVNYRVGGFGFLPGKEILADGSANLGLLDQRLGLQWMADNIGAFGGDPDKVTIWGEFEYFLSGSVP
jgi:carboxylesterase type B